MAVIGAPGVSWISQRDQLLLGMLCNEGTRVSEIIGVHVVMLINLVALFHSCRTVRLIAIYVRQ